MIFESSHLATRLSNRASRRITTHFSRDKRSDTEHQGHRAPHFAFSSNSVDRDELFQKKRWGRCCVTLFSSQSVSITETRNFTIAGEAKFVHYSTVNFSLSCVRLVIIRGIPTVKVKKEVAANGSASKNKSHWSPRPPIPRDSRDLFVRVGLPYFNWPHDIPYIQLWPEVVQLKPRLHLQLCA